MEPMLSTQITTHNRRAEPKRFTIRTLAGQEDYERFCQLERLIWGDDFAGLLNPVILMISQKVGALAAGAFDEQGEIRALIYGLTGPREGALVHWSHVMGVHPDYRDCGLGKHMKLFQRMFVVPQGVHDIQWTYDPLESKNAHLNICQLGGLPISYHINVYGDGSKNTLHAGLGTDRFIISWRVTDERVEHILQHGSKGTPDCLDHAPAVNTDELAHPYQGEYPLPDGPLVRVEIPRMIQEVKKVSGQGALWRENTRRAFVHYLGKGYRVVRFHCCRTTERSFYVLLAPGEDHT